MAANLTPEQESKIRSAYDLRLTVADASQRLGVGAVAIRNRYREFDAETKVEAVQAGEPASELLAERVEEFTEEGDKATVKCIVGADGVVTEEDLVRVCKIDLMRWRITRMKFKAYQGQMKVATRESDDKGRPRVVRETPHVVQLFSVSADLERLLPKPYLDAMDGLFERLASAAPAYLPLGQASWDPEYIVHLGLFDAHFAKLCWRKETGHDYDLKIAESVYANASQDLLRLLTPYPVGRFILPLGNDLFHIDSAKNATTGGTIVDTDGRYAKMIEVGEAAVIRLVERLMELAPVDVLYVPGNHDRLSSYHLCRAVSAWFRNAQQVSVDVSPSIRKYRRYGDCLFGWRHGDLLSDAQIPTLPGLMAVEAADQWGSAVCREWFLGHRHTSRRFVSRESDELQGVQIRYLSSLSGTDCWHHENNYIGNRRAAEAHIYSLKTGYVGHFIANARG